MIKVVVHSGSVTFPSDGMGLVNVDLINVSLDNNLTMMILKLLLMSDLWLGAMDISNMRHVKKR